jgi:hypothetical protein
MDSQAFASHLAGIISTKISELDHNILNGTVQDYQKAVGIRDAFKNVVDGIPTIHSEFINKRNQPCTSFTPSAVFDEEK